MIAELWCKLFGHKRKERVVVETISSGYMMEIRKHGWEYYSICPRCGEPIKRK